MSKQATHDADFLFNREWISLHAFKEPKERLAAIHEALQLLPELNIAEKHDIQKRVIRKMHTKRSNVSSAKRQKIEPPASASAATAAPAVATASAAVAPASAAPAVAPPQDALKLEPMLPLMGEDGLPGVTRLTLNDKEEIVRFRFNDWESSRGAISCIHSFDKEFIDSGQFFSGIIISDTYVVKLISEDGGLRFELPAKAAKAQEDYYRFKHQSGPSWNYRPLRNAGPAWNSSKPLNVTIHASKIASELQSMLEMQKLSLGPAIFGVLVERGKCYDRQTL
jgi:hypothetical protein